MRYAGSACGGDVKPVLALARAIADQRGRRAKPDHIGLSRHQPGCPRPGPMRHRDGGVGTRCLRRRKTQEIRQCLRVVGDLRLDQQPGPAGHAQQFANRAAAATGNRQSGLTPGRMERGDQSLPRGLHRVHRRAYAVCRCPVRAAATIMSIIRCRRIASSKPGCISVPPRIAAPSFAYSWPTL